MKKNTVERIETPKGTALIHTPAALFRQATDIASICKEIVVKTAVLIGKRKHVPIEGWQAIATAHGCILSAVDVRELDTGWAATGQVRRIDTGAVIATAEGFVGNNEKEWSCREEFACRAMAQTRAMSRAGRSAFAHVVVLMDAGLETTPSEEVKDGDKPFKKGKGAKTVRQDPAPTSGLAGADLREEFGQMLDQFCGGDAERMSLELEKLTEGKDTKGKFWEGKKSMDRCPDWLLQKAHAKLKAKMETK